MYVGGESSEQYINFSTDTSREPIKKYPHLPEIIHLQQYCHNN
jgi:hypothetical protein